MLRKTKEKLYPKVLDNYRGSRDMNLGQTQNLRHSHSSELFRWKGLAPSRLIIVQNETFFVSVNINRNEKVISAIIY